MTTKDKLMLQKPIRSRLTEDPDYTELIAEFVSNIPTRVRSIRHSIAANDSKQVNTLIHQLKGACGSYGFHEITPIASAIEHRIALGTEMSRLVSSIESLLEACLQMTAIPLDKT